MLRAKSSGTLFPLQLPHPLCSPPLNRRRRALLAVSLLSALLVALLLWPPGPAQAQDGEPTISFTAKIDPWTRTTDDVALTGLALPEGYTIAPEFQTSTYSYTLTTPAETRRLTFKGRFTSPPYYCDRGQSRCPGFGVLALGAQADLEATIDIGNSRREALRPRHVFLANDHHPLSPTALPLAAPGSTTTVELRVYKKLPGQAKIAGLHHPEISVWKIYTLAVTRELPDDDDATLYDLAISEGWLNFNPDTASYIVAVQRDVESVVLTPTALHPQATVTVNGNDPSTAVSLNEGNNVIPVVVTAPDGVATQTYQVAVVRGVPGVETGDFSKLIAQMYEWRNDPQWASYKAHTDRWDRALLAFGEKVADTTLTPMTAAEAQALAERGSAWHRWKTAAAALRALEAINQQRRQEQQGAPPTIPIPQDLGQPPNQAPTVSAALPDVSSLEVGATREVSLSGVFDDADGDSLAITATSSGEAIATATVAADQAKLTLMGVSEGTVTITVTAQDTDGSRVSDAFDVSVAPEPPGKYAALIAQMYQWRNDPCCLNDKAHTDRWDRTLLAFEEAVSNTSLTPMTASEAQGYADRGWTRWVEVAAALEELESGGQPDPANRPPTVSNAIADVTIVNESGTHQVSLTGVFDDADSDPLTITAGSDDEAVATESMAPDYSALTVTANSRGTATITVTADDGNGGTVSDTFTVRVKAAPVVASTLADVASLEVDATQEVSLSGVFSDADGDNLTITATSSGETIATATVAADQSKLTVAGVAEGTATITVTAEDSDGNRVSDEFDVSVADAEAEVDQGGPSVVANLRCIAETKRVAFLWDAPEWSGGETYAYDYELTLPDGRSEAGRLIGGTLLLRPGEYQAGGEASVSVKAVYELADGKNVSSDAETLTCTVAE